MTTFEDCGDPISRPFWAGAERGELRIQRCADCGSHQFYPRPFCLSCDSSEVEWVTASGAGVVHSLTEVHIRILPELEPPYLVAVVELAEGPRLTTNIVDGPAAIGDRVRVRWRARADAPPVPVFAAVSDHLRKAPQ